MDQFEALRLIVKKLEAIIEVMEMKAKTKEAESCAKCKVYAYRKCTGCSSKEGNKEMKLKTLIDFRGDVRYTQAGMYTDSFMIDSEILKLEAINWIKKHGRGWTPASAFKDFFNISEEDLK